MEDMENNEKKNKLKKSDGPFKKDINTDQRRYEWIIVECCCGSKHFEIIYTDYYETCAKCIICGYMDIIHEG